LDIISSTAAAFTLLFSADAALWRIIFISLGVSIAALALAAPLAFMSAYALTAGHFIGRRFVLILLQSFLSFPTVVVGLILYLLLSRNGPLGAWDLLFSPSAMIIGQMIIAYPVLTVFMSSALQKNGMVIRETVRGLGAGRFRAMLTEWNEARFGMVAALLAGFGRVVSEVGCALIIGGNIAGHTRTIPTAIVLETGKGNFVQGIALGIVLVFLALTASAVLSLLQGKGE